MVTIGHPNGDNKKLDIAYYCGHHIPMVQRLLGGAPKGVSVDADSSELNRDPRLHIWQWAICCLSPCRPSKTVSAHTLKRLWATFPTTRTLSHCV